MDVPRVDADQSDRSGPGCPDWCDPTRCRTETRDEHVFRFHELVLLDDDGLRVVLIQSDLIRWGEPMFFEAAVFVDGSDGLDGRVEPRQLVDVAAAMLRGHRLLNLR